MLWGGILGGVPLALAIGPGLSPVQGIGSVLNFILFALGPLALIPVFTIGVAFGVAGGGAVLWASQGRATWMRWASAGVLLSCVALLTLGPTAHRHFTNSQAAKARDHRAQAIARADFTGTLAGHRLAFPASPLLSLSHDCTPPQTCGTAFTNPVSRLTQPDKILLHERTGPVKFHFLSINAIETNCNMGEYCLTQEKIDTWCRSIRPDMAQTIWCQTVPPKRFVLVSTANPGPSDRFEPDLAANYADTPLGRARVYCFYAPDQSETHRHGASCTLFFDLKNGIMATLFAPRTQLTSKNPEISKTLALIPAYWNALTASEQ